MQKVLITSGGTKEYIDDVRVLTNISSGKLGAVIAETFLSHNKFQRHTEPDIKYEVHFVMVKGSQLPFFIHGFMHTDFKIHEVTDVQSVYDVMEKLVPEMDIVIHCMAVSDFGFKPIKTKLKSSDPEAFIESLKERIYQTPKILPMIKQWNPNCKLVSFKFEVNVTHDELIDIAKKSMLFGKSDIVIANDKSEMVENKSHIAYGVYNDDVIKLLDKYDIANFIIDKI